MAQNSSSTPQPYTTLTYIEGTGTQYIQTNITTANGMKIVSKFWAKCPNSTTGGTNGDGRVVLWTGGNQYDILMYVSSGARLYAGNGSYLRYRAYSAFTAGRYLKLLVNIDGETASSASRLGYIVGTDTNVFNSTSFSAISSASDAQTASYGPICLFHSLTHTNPNPSKFYGMEITENNVVTHNLVPAMRNSDGAVGVLDQTTNTFYLNAGTGSFNYA